MPVSTENFSPAAQDALRLAAAMRKRKSINFICSDHVLIGLVQVDCKAVEALREIYKINPSDVLEKSEEKVVSEKFEKTEDNYRSPRVEKILELAIEESRRRDSSWVTADDIFLGMLLEGDGCAIRILEDLGVKRDVLIPHLRRMVEMVPSNR